jgi:hypothetical protein
MVWVMLYLLNKRLDFIVGFAIQFGREWNADPLTRSPFIETILELKPQSSA